MSDFQGHGGEGCNGRHESLEPFGDLWCNACRETCTPDRGCKGCRLYLLEQAAARVEKARIRSFDPDVDGIHEMADAIKELTALLPKERTT